jgi:hypothetical protein
VHESFGGGVTSNHNEQPMRNAEFTGGYEPRAAGALMSEDLRPPHPLDAGAARSGSSTRFASDA